MGVFDRMVHIAGPELRGGISRDGVYLVEA